MIIMAKKENTPEPPEDEKPDGLTDNEFTQYKMVLMKNDMVIRTHPVELKMNDVLQYTEKLQTFPIVFNDGHMLVHWKELKGGVYNQVIEDIARELGANPNPTIAERRKQDELMRLMIVRVGDWEMQTSDGVPIEQRWIQIPSDLYEQIRMGFFSTTGEIKRQLEEGTGMTIEKMISLLKNVKDGKNGKIVDQELTLKK